MRGLATSHRREHGGRVGSDDQAFDLEAFDEALVRRNLRQDFELVADAFSQFRAPGVGLRITLPAMGPAPIALDFAVPVAYAPYDSKQLFSFFVGFAR